MFEKSCRYLISAGMQKDCDLGFLLNDDLDALCVRVPLLDVHRNDRARHHRDALCVRESACAHHGGYAYGHYADDRQNRDCYEQQG